MLSHVELADLLTGAATCRVGEDATMDPNIFDDNSDFVKTMDDNAPDVEKRPVLKKRKSKKKVEEGATPHATDPPPVNPPPTDPSPVVSPPVNPCPAVPPPVNPSPVNSSPVDLPPVDPSPAIPPSAVSPPSASIPVPPAANFPGAAAPVVNPTVPCLTGTKSLTMLTSEEEADLLTRAPARKVGHASSLFSDDDEPQCGSGHSSMEVLTGCSDEAVSAASLPSDGEQMAESDCRSFIGFL